MTGGTPVLQRKARGKLDGGVLQGPGERARSPIRRLSEPEALGRCRVRLAPDLLMMPPAFGRWISIRPARARGGAPEAGALPGTRMGPRWAVSGWWRSRGGRDG
jgi:hypothetical protein